MNRVPFVSSWCGPAGYEEAHGSANVVRRAVVDPTLRARFYVFGGCVELEQYWAKAWEWVPGIGWLGVARPKKGTWQTWLEEADEISAAAAIEAAAIAEAAAEAAAEALRLYWTEHKATADQEAAARLRAPEARQKRAKRNRNPRTGRAGGPGRCL